MVSKIIYKLVVNYKRIKLFSLISIFLLIICSKIDNFKIIIAFTVFNVIVTIENQQRLNWTIY